METKFTKGKWICKKSLYCNIIVCNNKHIASISSSDEENVKLICSAPDLFAALEHIIEYWNRDRNDGAMHDALCHIIETAEEAIKKATDNSKLTKGEHK